MSQPFTISWHDFIIYAMLEIKNGWPLLQEDEVKFTDPQGNPFTVLPSHVVITLHKKKVPQDGNQNQQHI